MKIGNLIDLLKLRRLRAFRRRRAAARTRPEQEPALRAELFSTEQMERHGRGSPGRATNFTACHQRIRPPRALDQTRYSAPSMT